METNRQLAGVADTLERLNVEWLQAAAVIQEAGEAASVA
jgi:hypothetical protein